jgi:hypothetical protein
MKRQACTGARAKRSSPSSAWSRGLSQRRQEPDSSPEAADVDAAESGFPNQLPMDATHLVAHELAGKPLGGADHRRDKPADRGGLRDRY